MKLIINKILLFFIPVMLIVIGVFYINVPDKFKGTFLNEDCTGRYKQLVNRLKTKTPIDLLFIGSSKTMNGVNDSLLQQITKQYCYNSGYCRYGRNMDFLIANRFVNQFDIKKIVLEVREEESSESHPVFAQLAGNKELLLSAKAANFNLLNDAFNHFLFNLSYLKYKIGLEKIVSTQNSYSDFGYLNQNSNTFDSTGFSVYNIRKKINTQSLIYYSANYYLKQFSQLCKKNNIQLYFLYLPNYNAMASKPLFIKEYSNYGKLIIAPDSVLITLKNYADKSHFNQQGSVLFTQSISQYLK